MNKAVVVTLALGSALAILPTAQADSFGYRSNDSSDASRSSVRANPSGAESSIDGMGAFAMNDLAGTFPASNGAQSNPVNERFSANNSGGSGLSGDGEFAFDGAMSQTNTVSGLLERGGALVDRSGNQLNLLFGSFNSRERASSSLGGSAAAGGKGNLRSSKGMVKNNSMLVAGAATLAATPEPGSLFLLGTGLLGMALVLFRKSAKRSTES